MAIWGLSFKVQGKHLDQVLEVLQPYKVEDLDMKIVAGTATKIRQGDQPGWKIVASAASTTPHRAPHFNGALKSAGFKGGVHSHLKTAVENGAMRRVKVKGQPHYVKAGK